MFFPRSNNFTSIASLNTEEPLLSSDAARENQVPLPCAAALLLAIEAGAVFELYNAWSHPAKTVGSVAECALSAVFFLFFTSLLLKIAYDLLVDPMASLSPQAHSSGTYATISSIESLHSMPPSSPQNVSVLQEGESDDNQDLEGGIKTSDTLGTPSVDVEYNPLNNQLILNLLRELMSSDTDNTQQESNKTPCFLTPATL